MSLSRRLAPISRFSRCFSVVPDAVKENPSKYVQGITAEQIEKDEELAAFLAANFGDSVQPEAAAAAVEVPDEFDNEEETEEETEEDVATKELNRKREALNIRTLHCVRRDPVKEEGSRRCRELRDQRMIPGLLYGSDPNQGIKSTDHSSKIFVKTPWNLLQRELMLFHHDFESRVYDLTVYENPDEEEGVVHRVLPRDMQRHPYQNKLYCINYLRYYPGRPVKIPIRYINEEESPALKRGGFIAPVSRYLECVIDDEQVPIPTHVNLECTDLRLKDVVRMDRIIIPEGVRPSKKVNPAKFLVGTVFGRRGAKADDDDEQEDKE